MSWEKGEKHLRQLLDDASTPSSTSERDPYSDEDGEYGSDGDYQPNLAELSSSDAGGETSQSDHASISGDSTQKDEEENLDRELPPPLSPLPPPPSLKELLPLPKTLPQIMKKSVPLEITPIMIQTLPSDSHNISPMPEVGAEVTIPQNRNFQSSVKVDDSSDKTGPLIQNHNSLPSLISANAPLQNCPESNCTESIIQDQILLSPSISVDVCSSNHPETEILGQNPPTSSNRLNNSLENPPVIQLQEQIPSPILVSFDIPSENQPETRIPNQNSSPWPIGGESQQDNMRPEGIEHVILPSTSSNNLVATSSNNTTGNSTEVIDNDEWSSTVEPIPEFGFDIFSQGLRVGTDCDATELDIFKLVLSEELLDFIITRTNAYGANLVNVNRPHTRHSRKQSFRPVTKDEMLAFLGLCLLQGQTRPPKRRTMFSYSDPLYYHPFYSYIMSARRYEQILRCISCAEPNAKGEKKISDFIEAVCENFRRIFGPEQELSLDESLILFRGRLHFRQYIKSKKARYGIKFYELTSADGYILNIVMYSGKDDSDCEEGIKKTEKIVMKLLRPYLMKGHHVFMDNFYNDVELSQKLLDLRTHTTGTLRKSRKSNPKVLMTKKLKKGDHFWSRKKQVYVSVWKDKRPVHVLTTKFHPKLKVFLNRHRKITEKPEEVAEYNKYMGGIDRKDQMVSYYSSPQKTIRWYKKVFFHMLDVTVWNAFYLYKKYYKRNRKYEFLDFRDALIKQMTKVRNDLKGRDTVRAGSIYSSRRHTQSGPLSVAGPSVQQASRQGGHWPEDIPVPENSKRNVKYLNCCLCTKNKKRKETRYRCKGCTDKTPLCPSCFEEWHEKYVEL